MKSTVKLTSGAAFDATSGSGHTIVIDGSSDIGGKNLGARPMEVVLMGTGGCMGMNMISILAKSRQEMTGLTIELEVERAPEPPAVFTKVHMHLIVEGNDLRESSVSRALELSADKYCSASMMLAQTAEITHSFEIVAAS